MNIENIKGFTHLFGAPLDWDHDVIPCDALPVKQVEGEAGVVWMVSQWKPTAEELAVLLANGSIHLWVQGQAHPVVAIGVNS